MIIEDLIYFALKNAAAYLGVGARVALRASDMCPWHVIFASRVILPSAVIFAFGELFMRERIGTWGPILLELSYPITNQTDALTIV